MDAAKDLTTVTVSMLVQGLKIMLDALNMDTKLYSLNSLGRVGATADYRVGVGQMDLKWHGLWVSGIYWSYVTSPCIAQSPAVSALANTMAYTN